MPRAFSPYSSQRTEPDLRAEFGRTMDGFFPEMAKKQIFVFRKMRTENGILVPCSCVDVLTREPDKDTFCPFCLGEGNLWDESLVDGYKVLLGRATSRALKEEAFDPGLANLNTVSFFFRYNLDPNIFPKRGCPDKIIELMTDVEGQPIRPYQRERIYRIGSAVDFRSDQGRLEFWRIDTYEEQVKFLNGPQG